MNRTRATNVEGINIVIKKKKNNESSLATIPSLPCCFFAYNAIADKVVIIINIKQIEEEEIIEWKFISFTLQLAKMVQHRCWPAGRCNKTISS